MNITQEKRNEILEKYYPSVENYATILSRKINADYGDIIGIGTDSLLSSLDKAISEEDFNKYLYIKMKGSLIDALRKENNFSRSKYQNKKKLSDAETSLIMRLNRKPRKEELANELDMDISDFIDFERKLTTNKIVYIDGIENKDEFYVRYGLFDESPDSIAIEKEQYSLISKAFSSLDEKEKKIIYYYYFLGLNMREIADYLGKTVGRISQIHLKSIEKIKEYVQA